MSMLRAVRNASRLAPALRAGRWQSDVPAKSGSKNEPEHSGSTIRVEAAEWQSVMHQLFGLPLSNYYKSRYPEVSRSDLDKIREELRQQFYIKGNWEDEYKKNDFPKEMFSIRHRLEAELDPTNAKKLKALEHGDGATADPCARLRQELMDTQSRLAADWKEIGSVRADFETPSVDWAREEERHGAPLTAARRERYEKLKSINLQWDEELVPKWVSAFTDCELERQKDIDIDYLRYLEGHIRDQIRAEKWYKRLKEDGESTLTLEEVEAWMPEFTDTLYVDYEGWWELVGRGTEASQWDRYNTTAPAYAAAQQRDFAEQKSAVEDRGKLDGIFRPKSLFEVFRHPPQVVSNVQ